MAEEQTTVPQKHRGQGPALLPHQVILRPLVTEKGVHRSTRLNAYAFQVSTLATKTDVRAAIESLFNVKVLQVRTQNRKGKPRRVATAAAAPRIGRRRSSRCTKKIGSSSFSPARPLGRAADPTDLAHATTAHATTAHATTAHATTAHATTAHATTAHATTAHATTAHASHDQALWEFDATNRRRLAAAGRQSLISPTSPRASNPRSR